MVESDGEIQIIQMPSSYTFLPAQLQLLHENADTVKSKENAKERSKLIKSIRRQILALPDSQNQTVQERTDLATAVDTWFSLRSKQRGKKIKWGKKWNGRLVLYEENKQRINELKVELFEEGSAKGKDPKTPFHYLQRAISQCWNELSREDQETCDILAKKWNKEGVSREQKQQ